jgi:hypothetical protein
MNIVSTTRNCLASLALVGIFICNLRGSRADDLHGMHGDGHDQLHHWYQTLKQPKNGASCCNNQDCRPTQSRMINGEVQVEIDGEWTIVPREKILNVPSVDLQSHVCAPSAANGMFPKGYIYCVILGLGV